ncbi:MAG: WYL domain-containing protein [Oscillospiraceae bacterium]
MNKAERLNDLMFYLNDKSSFNLKDIIKKYSISKSTALRDIQSLEELGMPIYSKYGRNGCYEILQNRLLSPIMFNLDEVSALYFSMLTLRDYETTPFHLSVEKLKQKFEHCLSPEKIEMLKKTEKVFRLGSIQQNNRCDFLKDILQFAIEEKICQVTYQKKDTLHLYIIQFFDISATFGQWYATGYNFETECIQVLRCDKVVAIKENFKYQPKPFAEFANFANELYKTADAKDFEVTVSAKGVDLFYKEHYPSMGLDLENGQYFIRGFYNKGEENFIANYFIAYGENILSVKPMELSKLILAKLDSLHQHFLSI